MLLGAVGPTDMNEALLLVIVAAVAAAASFSVFLVCLFWFRREQKRMQRKILHTIVQSSPGADDLFVTGRDVTACGELVAQFRVKQGKQVVSVLEADGRRFIHVDGELSAPERARMVRYLRSEGFMS